MPITLGTYGATDSTGWSTLTPPANSNDGFNASTTGSNLLHVSKSTGSDSNPGSEAFPYETLAFAISKMRVGAGDWILLKCGDVFPEWFGQHSTGWGKSATDPWVLTSYGTGARPILKGPPGENGESRIMRMLSPNPTYFAWVGIDFYPTYRDPDHADFLGRAGMKRKGYINTLGKVEFALIENCRFRFLSDMSISGSNALYTKENVYVRRNSFGPTYWSRWGVPILLAGGSAFGDLTGGGNLASAFDEVRSQAMSASATKASATEAYIGYTFAEPSECGQVKVYGSSDQGFVNGANPNVTIEVYAKNGAAPANATDGTSIGSQTFVDQNFSDTANPRTISTSSTALWDHVWIRVTHDGSAATMAVGEAAFLEEAGDQSINFYTSQVVGTYFIEENVFDWGGWYLPAFEVDPYFGHPHEENHNTYISPSGGTFGPTLRGNIGIRASAQAFSRDGTGGFIRDNLAIHAPLWGYLGWVDSGANNGPWEYTDNVYIHGMHRVFYESLMNNHPNLPRSNKLGGGSGFDMRGPLNGTQVRRNLCLHMYTTWGYTTAGHTGGMAFKFVRVTDNECLDNIVYNYKVGTIFRLEEGATLTAESTAEGGNLLDPDGTLYSSTNPYGWPTEVRPGPNPNRTIETYDIDILGGDGTLDSFASAVLANEKSNWDTNLTATVINDYFRAGFGLVDEEQTATTPSVTTDSITNLTFDSVTLAGTVLSTGGAAITERGFAVGSGVNPDIVSDTKIAISGSVGGYNHNLGSLTELTTYHVRAFATNSEGTAYGNDVEFTTLEAPDNPSVVTTGSISKLTNRRIHISGNVTDDGGSTVTERGFVYNQSGAPTTSDSKVIVSGTTGVYSAGILGLTPGQTYFVRAFSTTSAGTSYGTTTGFTMKVGYRTAIRLLCRS